MSLQFLDQPASYSPAYNDMMHIVRSNNAQATNFYVKCKVRYFDDVETDYIQIGKDLDLFCVPGTDYILFSPDRLLRNYVDDDFDVLIGSSTSGQQSSIGEHYQIEFQEWMGTIPQASGSALTSNAYTFNAAIERKSFADYNENDFVINSTSLARFATPQTEVRLRELDTYMLTVMSETTGSTALYTKLRVEKFDLSGNSLGTSDLTMLSPEDDTRNRFQSIRCGPAQVGVTDVSYYEVWAASAANTQRTSKFRVYIDRECSQYDVHSIYYLNRYGGIDMLNFPLISRKKVNIERSMYNRPVGQVNADELWELNSYDREKSVFFTKITHQNIYNTDYLTDEQVEQMKELYTSPKIWVYDGVWTSMFIDATEYEIKTVLNDGLIQEQITLTESLTSTRQR